MTSKNTKFNKVLQKPTGHADVSDLLFRTTDPIETAEALEELTVEAQERGEYDIEPTVKIDGEAVITIANLQKLINSLVFKLLSN